MTYYICRITSDMEHYVFCTSADWVNEDVRDTFKYKKYQTSSSRHKHALYNKHSGDTAWVSEIMAQYVLPELGYKGPLYDTPMEFSDKLEAELALDGITADCECEYCSSISVVEKDDFLVAVMTNAIAS